MGLAVLPFISSNPPWELTPHHGQFPTCDQTKTASKSWGHSVLFTKELLIGGINHHTLQTNQPTNPLATQHNNSQQRPILSALTHTAPQLNRTDRWWGGGQQRGVMGLMA